MRGVRCTGMLREVICETGRRGLDVAEWNVGCCDAATDSTGCAASVFAGVLIDCTCFFSVIFADLVIDVVVDGVDKIHDEFEP